MNISRKKITEDERYERLRILRECAVSGGLYLQYFEKNEDEIVEYELRCAKKIILKKQPQMEREEIEQFLYRKGYSLEITKEAFEEV